MNRRLSRRALLMAAGGAATSLALGSAALADPAIRAGATFAEGFAELFYAQAEGTIKKAGLEVSITKFPSGPTMMPALLGGSLDIGISDTVSLGAAIAKGAPFVLIAGAALHRSAAPQDALCVALDSPIKQPHDLAGQPVAVLSLGGITEIALRAWLDQNGMKPDQIKIIELPLTQIPAAIARGTVAAGFVAEPFLSQSKGKTIRVLDVPFNALAPQFLISSWFTSRAYAQQNRATVKRIADLIYDIARWANAHPELSAPILAGVASVPVATVFDTTRTVYGTSLEPRLLDPVFSAMYKYGFIQRALTAGAVTM